MSAVCGIVGMSVLRCKTPEMVMKEAWMYMLAYNLIRGVMAEAATLAEVEPRELSFAGAVQTLVAFSPALQMATAEDLPRLWEIILRAIARHRVADRPDRYEPRAVKRRSKPIAILTNTPSCWVTLPCGAVTLGVVMANSLVPFQRVGRVCRRRLVRCMSPEVAHNSPADRFTQPFMTACRGMMRADKTERNPL